MKSRSTKTLYFLLFFFSSVIFVNSCQSNIPGGSRDYSQSESVFEVSLPEPLQDGEKIYIELIDEVTGVALNPTRFELQAKDQLTYSLRIPLVTGSTVQYRYVKIGATNIIESMTNGEKVYYRVYLVKGPSVIHDVIPGWDNQPYQGLMGEIGGYIFDSKSEAPLNEILVFVNGMRGFTGSDGFFEIENVPVGEHHLVALHPDGTYQTFQQGAVIAVNALTPASFGMELSKKVTITFDVTVPDETPNNAQIRLLGNSISLGNSFSDMGGGTSITPARSPLLEKKDNKKYRISLVLPAGYDLRYKYSLGDGFINSEYGENGKLLTRQFIVPSKDFTVNDSIKSWSSTSHPPVVFNVDSPSSTPGSDIVSIQFNPYTWLPSIPMWKTGENHWTYSLFSPFEYLDQSQYRFCRNDQCGIADDQKTPGSKGLGYVLGLSTNPPSVINYSLESWIGLESFGYDVQQVTVPQKTEAYIKGIQLSNQYHFSWVPYFQSGFIDTAVNGFNWVIFSPSWSFRNVNSNPTIQFWPNNNPSVIDLAQVMNLAGESNQLLALFPIPAFDDNFEDYWQNSPKTYNWWQEWFNQYERFILSYADLASNYNIPALIIGGNHVSPAFPNGKLTNGASANTPFEFKDRWGELISKVNEHYQGMLIIALPSSIELSDQMDFVNQSDLIYYTFDHSLSSNDEPLLSDLHNSVEKLLNNKVYQLYAYFQKPILISLNYPSVNGSSRDCTNYDRSCGQNNLKDENNSSVIDIKEQADIYQSVIQGALSRDWIFGIISNGFNPSVSILDSSSSIRGKPAMSVASYYFRSISK